jgi:hypothetical protein
LLALDPFCPRRGHYRGCPIIRRNSGSKYDQILTPRVIIRRLGFF